MGDASFTLAVPLGVSEPSAVKDAGTLGKRLPSEWAPSHEKVEELSQL